MPFSVFEYLTVRFEEAGLVWLLEFASLLFGSWTAAAIAGTLIIAISRIPNALAMGITASLVLLAFVFTCLDAVSWRQEVPTGVGYPVLATVTYFILVLATGWSWKRGR